MFGAAISKWRFHHRSSVCPGHCRAPQEMGATAQEKECLDSKGAQPADGVTLARRLTYEDPQPEVSQHALPSQSAQ